MNFNIFENFKEPKRLGTMTFDSLIETVKTNKELALLPKENLPVCAIYIDGDITEYKTLVSIFNKDDNDTFTTFKGKSPKIFFIDIDPETSFKLFIKSDNSTIEEKTKYKQFLKGLKKSLFNNLIFKAIKSSASGYGLNCFVEVGYEINNKEEFDYLQEYYFNLVKDILNKILSSSVNYSDKIEVDFKAKGAYRVCNVNYDNECLSRSNNTILNDKPLIERVTPLKTNVSKECNTTFNIKKVKSSQSNLIDNKDLLKIFTDKLVERNLRLDNSERLSIATVVRSFEPTILDDTNLFDTYFKEILNISLKESSKHKTYDSIASEFKYMISRYNSHSTINSIKRLAKDKFNIDIKYSQYKTHILYVDKYASEVIDEVKELSKNWKEFMIIGQPGIGKSKLLKDIIMEDDSNCLYLSPSTMLNIQFGGNDMNILCEGGRRIENCNKYSSTFDSFNKISNIKFNYAIIDESHILIDAVDYRQDAINNSKYIKAKQKIFTTATPNSQLYFGHKIIIKKRKVDKQQLRVIRTNNIGNVMTDLQPLLHKSKFLYFDSSKENLNKYSEMFCGATILTSYDKKSEIFKEICETQFIRNDIKYLFTTKLMEMGINLLNTDYDYIVINNIERKFNCNDIEQMMARFRKINIKVILIQCLGINKEYKLPTVYNMFKETKTKCLDFINKLKGKYNIEHSLLDNETQNDNFSLKKMINLNNRDEGYLSLNQNMIKKESFDLYSQLVLQNDKHLTEYFVNNDVTIEEVIVSEEDKIKIKATETLYKRNKAFFIENLERMTNFKLSKVSNKTKKRIFNNKEDETFFYANINKQLADAADTYVRYKYFNIPAEKCLREQDVKRFLDEINKDKTININETSCIINLEERNIAEMFISKIENDREYTISQILIIFNEMRNDISLPLSYNENGIGKFITSILSFDKKRVGRDKVNMYSNFKSKFEYTERGYFVQ